MKELETQFKTHKIINKRSVIGKPFERFRIINQANSAALPNSKHNNAANPNPIKTTLGISAFSNSSAGKTSVPLQNKNTEKNKKKTKRERKEAKRYN